MLPALMGLPAKCKAIYDLLFTTADATIGSRAPASTALSNANYTSARAGYLDKLNISGTVVSEDSPLLDVPIASGLVGDLAIVIANATNLCGITTANNSTTNTFSDAVNYTGQGVLEFAAVMTASGAAISTLEVLIDGISVSVVATTSTNDTVNVAVGAISRGSYWNGAAVETFPIHSLGAVPFKTSLQIRHKPNTAGQSRCHYKYRKTS